LAEARLVAKENQGILLVRQAPDLGPGVLLPCAASGFIEVIGDKTRFLEREAQTIQEFTHVVRVIGDTKVP